jgi:hypothetical protein
MNLQELMELVYMDSGEPTDLNPYLSNNDPANFDFLFASLPGRRLRQIVNMAQTRIANWRLRSGRQIYHRACVKTKLFDFKPLLDEVLVSSVDTTTRTTLTLTIAGGTFRDGFFEGWMAGVTTGTATTEFLRILRSWDINGTQMSFELEGLLETATTPATLVSLYPDGLDVVPAATATAASAYQLEIPGGSLDVMRILDFVQGSSLATVQNTDVFTNRTFGTLSQYKRVGRKIYFDTFIEEATPLEITYRTNPIPLTAYTDVPELEEPFHQAIALWATHDVMRRNQDFNGAYATKRELEDLLEMLFIQTSSENSLEQGGVTVYG